MEPRGESKYERLRKIGIGSYGVVFKCVNRHTGQIVAIKRYSEDDSDPMIRKIAMREVRMLRQLRHPNLIHLIEVFRRKRRLHLVFDYCELTVLDVIEKYTSNCPLNLIRKIIWQLVNGVSHCHSHNCIHRDIKPENILINQAGVVKLCDFGFARSLSSSARMQPTTVGAQMMLANSGGGLATSSRQQLEREAQLLGVPSNQMVQWFNGQGSQQQQLADKENAAPLTASAAVATDKQPAVRQPLTEYVATRWYRAPELLVGEVHYDAKIDIWAIGCVAAELMRGEPIWPGKTDLDQLQMILCSLGSLTPSLARTLSNASVYDSASTERLLGRSMATDPLERRLPPRAGRRGLEFVLECLQMEPNRRPSCQQLLQHSYIHSARMAQFVRGAESHTTATTAPTSTAASKNPAQAPSLASANSSSTTSLGSSPKRLSSFSRAPGSLIPMPTRGAAAAAGSLATNSSRQVINSISKRSVPGQQPTPTTNSKLVMSSATAQYASQATGLLSDQEPATRKHKRRLPAIGPNIGNIIEIATPVSRQQMGPTASVVRKDRDSHQPYNRAKQLAEANTLGDRSVDSSLSTTARSKGTAVTVTEQAASVTRSRTYRKLSQSQGQLLTQALAKGTSKSRTMELNDNAINRDVVSQQVPLIDSVNGEQASHSSSFLPAVVAPRDLE